MASSALDHSLPALHPHSAPSGISDRPLRSPHHGPHLCHCHRSSHCRLFLSHLRAHGGFRISAQTGRDDQSDLQKDGAQWKGRPAHGPGTRMRYHGHDDHPDPGHGKGRTIVTLLLALGVPCSAQLGVILGMFAGLPCSLPPDLDLL